MRSVAILDFNSGFRPFGAVVAGQRGGGWVAPAACAAARLLTQCEAELAQIVQCPVTCLICVVIDPVSVKLAIGT